MKKRNEIRGPATLGNRTLGALQYRKGSMDRSARQDQKGGSRYNLDVKKLAEEDRKKALQKATEIKSGKTMTGQRPDIIEMDPVKKDAIGQNQGLN